MPPQRLINVYEWLGRISTAWALIGLQVLFIFLPAFETAKRSYFRKRELVNTPKKLDSSCCRHCWLTGWLPDKQAWGTVWWTGTGLAGQLTIWLSRWKAVILELVVHWALHHTYHEGNVISSLHEALHNTISGHPQRGLNLRAKRTLQSTHWQGLEFREPAAC